MNPRTRLSLLVAATTFASATCLFSAASNSAVTPEQRSGRNYERFLRFNEIIQANPGNVDLIFVGDSITEGWEGRGKEVWQHYYGNRKAVNLGIGGDRTQHVLWRLDHGNVDGISPKVAVVMIGTNNSADDRNTAVEMVEGVTAVVKELREKLPQTKILLLGIFPRGAEFNNQRGKILQVNQVIQKMHDGEWIYYLDIGHAFVNEDGSISKDIMPDFLHPSAAGYQIWAEQMEPLLARLLGGEPILPPASPVAGNWSWTMPGPNGEPVDADVAFRVGGNALTGVFEFNNSRRLEVKDGSVSGNDFHFTIERDRPNGGVMVYQMSGQVESDHITGQAKTEMNGQEVESEWSATRK